MNNDNDDNKDIDEQDIDNDIYHYRYQGEVIGANGRIGSFLKRSFDNVCYESNDDHDDMTKLGLVAIPRQQNINDDQPPAPGSLTEKGCPIFVSIPATQLRKGKLKQKCINLSNDFKFYFIFYDIWHIIRR